jgi:hypothetical protein
VAVTREGPQAASTAVRLRRELTLWDLVFYGIVLIQPVAPMGIFGVVSIEARGHVITTILIGMVAMLLTALSYGRMARAYPSAGSAFTYVGQELHPGLGYATGWSMVMDYVLNPIIATIYCGRTAMNVLPEVPYPAWVILFAVLFTAMNLRGIKASARTNEVLAIGMFVVVIIYLVAAVRYLLGVDLRGEDLTRPFYDPATFSLPVVLTGASIACLTYIGFDGISTLSEEARNPRRDILLATVLTCLITGILAAVLVYSAQLVWGNWTGYPDVDTAFVHVAGKAGGPTLFMIVNMTLLVANVGSGSSAHALRHGPERRAAAAVLWRRRSPAENPAEQRGARRRADRDRRARAHLPARSRAPEFRRLHRVHGREPGGVRALLGARGGAHGDELRPAAPRVRHLPLSLDQPAPASASGRVRVACRRDCLRGVENARLPSQPDVVRCTRGVNGGNGFIGEAGRTIQPLRH